MERGGRKSRPHPTYPRRPTSPAAPSGAHARAVASAARAECRMEHGRFARAATSRRSPGSRRRVPRLGGSRRPRGASLAHAACRPARSCQSARSRGRSGDVQSAGGSHRPFAPQTSYIWVGRGSQSPPSAARCRWAWHWPPPPPPPPLPPPPPPPPSPPPPPLMRCGRPVSSYVKAP